MGKKTRLTISIDEELVKKLKHLAIDEGKTVSDIIEDLVKGLLRKRS